MGPRTCLLPLLGVAVLAPVAVFVVRPLLGSLIDDWPRWAVNATVAGATLALAGGVAVVIARFAARRDHQRHDDVREP